LISLRLRGHYFSIFTLCIGTIVYLLIEKCEAVTHGSSGILAIPAPPGAGPISFETPLGQYYLCLAALGLGTWLMHRIVHSLVGSSFIAVRNSEALAQAIGINLMRTKTLAFVISVVYAGLAGALYAGNVRFLGPDLAGAHHTFDAVMFMLVGGIGTTLGPLLGTVAVTWTTQGLQFLQDLRMVVFGPLLIVLLIFMPQGLVGTWAQVRARRQAAMAALESPPAPRIAPRRAGGRHA
jgi:branched-chain amino acid transport system permease protein